MGGILLIIFIVIGFYIYAQRSALKKITDQQNWLINKFNKLETDFAALMRGEVSLPELTNSEATEHEIKEVTAEEQELSRIDILKPWETRSEEEAAKTTSEPVQHATLASNSNFKTVEKDLSSRWMIWVGGGAFALGGAFLVKYSIDAGLMSPGVRVIMGTIIGLVMTVAGEGLRQRRAKVKWLSDYPDYVPSAISAAGLFTAFAAIYSSYALYQFIPALVAFAAIAGLSLSSSVLAIYQGRFFAYLGIIAGLIVPALVSTGSGNAWVLFPYLLLIIAPSLWVSRKKAWVDVVGVALFLAMLWGLFWIFTNWKIGDIIPVALYLLILNAFNSMFLSGASPDRSSKPTLAALRPTHYVSLMSDVVSLLSIVLLVSIVRLDHYSAAGFVLISIGLISQAYAVHKSAENDVGGLFAIFGIIFLFLTWHVLDLFEIETLLSDAQRRMFLWSPIAPPGAQTFITASFAYGAVIALAIFIRLPGLFRKSLWASFGNLLPLSILIIAYWRIKDFDTSIAFASVSLVLAVLFTYGVAYIHKHGKGQITELIATYAAGATTAVALSLAMVLRDEWLSSAFAIEIVALGFIWQKTQVNGLRHLALIISSIVLIRLFLNPAIFDYRAGSMPIFNWLFVAYGLSAVLFAYAAKIFDDKREKDRLISVLRGGINHIIYEFYYTGNQGSIQRAT